MIPDALFADVEANAAVLDTSRSEFLALAAQANAAVAFIGHGGVDSGDATWTATASRQVLDLEPW